MSIVGYCEAASSGRIKAAVATLLFASSATLFAWEDRKGAPAAHAAPHAAAPAHAAPAHAAPAHGAPGAQTSHPTTTGARSAPAGAHPAATANHAAPGGAHAATAGARSAPAGAHSTAAGARPGGFGGGSAHPGGSGHPGGGRDVRTAGGGSAHFNSRGQVQSVHAHGMDIRRGPGGVHRIERVGPGGRVIVTNGAGHGYVQRPFRYGGRDYYQRTYYVNGVPYGRAYRSYFYGGIGYGFYAPSRFWAPGFYGWAYSPWAVPIVYNFGWRGNPWFGFYGGYYTPYPVYSTPALWLTDYYMGATLQAAYQERMAEAAAAANGQAPPPPPDNQVALSPEVKQMIANEVQRQLQAERNEAAQAAPNAPPVDSPPPAFADNTPHIFVVKSGLDVTSQGQACPVTEGDVLQTRGALPTNSPNADAFVLASKGQDCAKGSWVSVAVQDLVEMQNHMRETIDQGLGDLQTKQGKGGIPAMPASYLATPTQANFVSSAPPPEQNIADELSRQAREANQAEQEVVSQALGTGNSAPAPAQQQAAPTTISLGQSTAEVVASFGQPMKVFNVGPKQIYVYKDTKITFLNGRVSDVQ